MAEKANESEFQGPNLENLELFVKPRTKLSVGRNAAIKSAELTFDREVIVLKNLSSLQPLSHLINEDAIMNKLEQRVNPMSRTHIGMQGRPMYTYPTKEKNFEISTKSKGRTKSTYLQKIYADVDIPKMLKANRFGKPPKKPKRSLDFKIRTLENKYSTVSTLPNGDNFGSMLFGSHTRIPTL